MSDYAYRKQYQGNPDIFGRVAVIYGGNSAERAISINSGSSVLSALQASGVDAFGVDIQGAVAEHIQQLQCDRVFIVLHGGDIFGGKSLRI